MSAEPLSRRREATPKLFDPHLIKVSTVTVLSTVMVVLDGTVVLVALDTLVRKFHTSIATVQWVTTGYMLSLATVVPLTRWILDHFGAKRTFMVALSLFVFGSAMCGFSWSISSLIVFRVVQGLGGGMIVPTTQTIIAREAGPERLGRVMTLLAIPSSIGPLLGPIVGGFILSDFSWRWIFLINLPLGAIAFYRASRHLNPEQVTPSRAFDLVGFFLLPPGLALFTYGIAEFGNVGTFDARDAFGLFAGAALIAVFVWHALRVNEPLVDLRLWKNRSLAASSLTMICGGAAVSSAVFLVQLYWQIARGESAFHSGLLTSPVALGSMICLPFASRTLDRYGARRIVTIGLVITGVMVIPYTQVTPTTPILLLSALWLCRGMGSGATFAPATAAGFMTLRSEQLPGATVLQGIVQQTGNSFGIAATAALLQRRIVNVVPGGVGGLASMSNATRVHLAPAICHAFGLTFATTIVLAVIGQIPARFLPTRKTLQDAIALSAQELALQGETPA